MIIALALLIQSGEHLLGEVSEKNLTATVEKLVSFETRMSLSDAEDPKRGIGAARNWIKSEFERHREENKGLAVIGFHEWDDPNPKLSLNGARVKQKNVYAILQGRNFSKEAIVIGAHYDSLNLRGGAPNAVAPGANDNASGVAAILEAFRILVKTTPERTIIFVAFAAEEQGLIGALHFANWLKERKEYFVMAMLNNDIVGGAKDEKGKSLNDGVLRCYSAPPIDSPSRRFARYARMIVENSATGLKLQVKDTVDRKGRGGDHQSFNEAGYAAIRFIEGTETDKIHHTPDDVVSRLTPSYHAKVVKADIAMLHNLANAPPAPVPGVVDVIGPGGGFNILRWKAVPGATRYVVGSRVDGVGNLRLEEVDASGEVNVDHRVGGGGGIYCVASIGANGAISLFSEEVSGHAAVPSSEK